MHLRKSAQNPTVLFQMEPLNLRCDCVRIITPEFNTIGILFLSCLWFLRLFVLSIDERLELTRGCNWVEMRWERNQISVSVFLTKTRTD